MNRKLIAWLSGISLVIAIACTSGGGDSGTGDKFIDNCHDARGVITHETTATSDIERCMVHGREISKRVKPKNAPGNNWG